MPLVRIDIVKGRSESQLSQLLKVVHDCIVEAFEVPYSDRYQTLNEHEPGRLVLEDTGLGLERTDQRVLLQIVTRPRTSEKKERFYKLITEMFSLHSIAAPEDVVILCVENGDADWSFGNGRAQFLTGEL